MMPSRAWIPLPRNRRSLMVYLGLAAVLVLLTLVLQRFEGLFGLALLVPYLLLVALAARFGGIGPAIFVSLATIPVVDLFLLGSPGRLDLPARTVLQLVLVVLVGLLLGWLLVRLRDERERAEVAAAAERAAVSERDALVSVIAHDLRSPLAAVRARVQLAGLALHKEPPDTSNALRSIEAALPQVDRVGRLLDDLLATGRTDSGTLEVKLTDLDLVPLVSQVVERWRDDAERHTVELELDRALPVVGDAGRIEQVLDNLIANAVKYSEPGTTIRVSGHAEDGEVRLAVADQGPGIPPEEREQIFERFYRRAEHRVGRQPGIGLGLFITRELIAAHGGRIEVESEPGQGSTFIVTLPLRETGENVSS